jgi:uncharacterized protein YprB with RNaseH-like and TPR domain
VTRLADRIRAVLGTPGGIGPGLLQPEQPSVAHTSHEAPSTRSKSENGPEAVLGGAWRQVGDFSCFVIENRLEPADTFGDEALGPDVSRLEDARDEAGLLIGAPVHAPFIFFDLETTGLSGGAGTYAFLVGCGWFEGTGAFLTRQYMLVRLADESSLLNSVALELAHAGLLVSFNGKSFDASLLESRFLYHRLDWFGARLPHLDMLHVARRFWGSGATSATTRAEQRAALRMPASGESHEPGCSLLALERHILGTCRRGDVPGFEIPSRYFHFLRTGDARFLRSVLEHNRFDLLTLAKLTMRVLELVRLGPNHARYPREALALARTYARAGLDTRAKAAYERVIELSGLPSGFGPHLDALRALARASRRSRRFDEAADYWQQILDIGACPEDRASEASEALAIHHEHRIRDLASAQAFALRSLKKDAHPTWNEAVRHRLARIQRKMKDLQFEASSLNFAEASDAGFEA